MTNEWNVRVSPRFVPRGALTLAQVVSRLRANNDTRLGEVGTRSSRIIIMINVAECDTWTTSPGTVCETQEKYDVSRLFDKSVYISNFYIYNFYHMRYIYITFEIF